MTTIEKIKVEIERRYKEFDGKTGDIATASRLAYLDVISFLSTLESEKPMEQNAELNEEIKKEMVKLPFFIRGKDQIAFARHFAQWGAEQARDQMMKEAVEGEVCIPNVWVEHKEGKELVVRAEISKELGFKFGDKVRVFIVKEG